MEKTWKEFGKSELSETRGEKVAWSFRIAEMHDTVYKSRLWAFDKPIYCGCCWLLIYKLAAALLIPLAPFTSVLIKHFILQLFLETFLLESEFCHRLEEMILSDDVTS